MCDKERLINRKALVLLNFWQTKHQNDKRIGDLTVGDFVELCEFLEQLDEVRNDAN